MLLSFFLCYCVFVIRLSVKLNTRVDHHSIRMSEKNEAKETKKAATAPNEVESFLSINSIIDMQIVLSGYCCFAILFVPFHFMLCVCVCARELAKNHLLLLLHFLYPGVLLYWLMC